MCKIIKSKPESPHSMDSVVALNSGCDVFERVIAFHPAAFNPGCVVQSMPKNEDQHRTPVDKSNVRIR
jgi:hypothetical protein